jgi:TatD DNase family protein
VLIDTHAHLDSAEYIGEHALDVGQLRQSGVEWVVVPAVSPENFATVRSLAHSSVGVVYSLGIHPLCVGQCPDNALEVLRHHLVANRDDPKLVAVGEIGLDHFIAQGNQTRQLAFFQAQLRLAREFNLPVILHVRRAVDEIARECRKFKVSLGIAHAFNGSIQQARALRKIGLHLGFGGAMTWGRALQIRRLAKQLLLEDIVLETDSPDIPPEWLVREHAGAPNSPLQLPRIGMELAQLRQVDFESVARITSMNACRALPKLHTLTQTFDRVLPV